MNQEMTEPWKKQQGQAARLQRGGSAEKGIQIIVFIRGGGERAKIRSNAAGRDRLKPDPLARAVLPLPLYSYQPSTLEVSQMKGKPQLCASYSWETVSKHIPGRDSFLNPRAPLGPFLSQGEAFL